MYSISAKIWLWLVALLVFLSSCSREGPDPVWEAQSIMGNEYKGGLFPVYIKLKEPVDKASSISWGTHYARIAYRNQDTNSKGQIITDTAFLYWETPPPLFLKLDSTQIKKDTTISWKVDTTRYYRDTVFAVVNNTEESMPIIIEVKNILPRIKTLKVGDISQPGDSTLTIAVNLGDKLNIQLNLGKTFPNSFNKGFHPIVTMPPIMGNLTLKSENDSTFVYEWAVPNEEIDGSGYLKIEDSGGYGERLYKIHLVVYTESGSVWVASEKELVKYSPSGIEVARIKGFNSISDISVNSNNGKLFVLDEFGDYLFISNNYGYGKQSNKDTSLFKLNLPSGIAVDVENNSVWIADAKNPLSPTFKARLRRFVLISDSLSPTSIDKEMSGPIKGLSINQFQRDFVWFAIPESDTVGFIKDLEPKFIQNTWNRPSMVSHDPLSGIAWIADSTRIVAIDTNGNILANITGFGFVSSVSASKNCVWASDILTGKVYIFKGSSLDTDLTVDSAPYRRVINGFISPISVSAYLADGGAWVVDKEAGMVVRLDSLGNKIASGTGLKQPLMGKTLQKVE